MTAIASVLIMFLAFSTVHAEQPQAATLFTPEDKFGIPEQNGTINFGFNGSYTKATFENGSWTFSGLTLNNSQALQTYGFTGVAKLGDLKIFAENSNVTVLAFFSVNFSFPIDILIFSVEGSGTQTVNLGLNSSQPTNVAEWSVVLDEGATFLAEGSGWDLLPDNSVRVNGGTGNVTVVHYDLIDPSMANLSFFMQHYVVILTAVAVAVTVAVAGVITFRIRRRKKA